MPSNLEEIACDLGVGKNMAKALRAWARAARLLHDDGRIAEVGERLFQKIDPYLERRQSVALLHWLVASNSQGFTAAAWLFNHNRRSTFTASYATSAFRDYLTSSGASYAMGTLRSDMEPVLRMHTDSHDAHHDATDDRFFSQLGLITAKRPDRTMVYSRTWEHSRPYLTEGLLLYALLLSLAQRKTPSATLSSLHMGSAHQTAPGAVFGLSGEGFFNMTEHLARERGSPISLSTMPGEDAMLAATGKAANSCAQGDLASIDSQFFGVAA